MTACVYNGSGSKYGSGRLQPSWWFNVIGLPTPHLLSLILFNGCCMIHNVPAMHISGVSLTLVVLKSPANRRFVQKSIQVNNKEIINDPHYWPLCEWNTPVTGGFSSQRASYAESVAISWHGMILFRYLFERTSDMSIHEYLGPPDVHEERLACIGF